MMHLAFLAMADESMTHSVLGGEKLSVGCLGKAYGYL